MSEYMARLHSSIRRTGNPVCVGLDPRWNDLPPEIRQRAEQTAEPAERWARAFEEFSLRVLDVVAPLVPVVKPQAAFFEECGPAGCAALARVIQRARQLGLVVICDAKRGDIGSTAEAYARGYLAGRDAGAAPWGADALTVSPYLGADTLEPFVKTATERGAGIYVLVRTSNPGSGVFQNRESDGAPLYRHVATVVEQLARQTRGQEAYGLVGAVVGATYPQELAELREFMPHTHFLIPGYGSQGGQGADVAPGFRADGTGAVVNSSRGILFAYQKSPFKEEFGPARWEDAVAAATRAMIADLAQHTPAGRLVSQSQGLSGDTSP